MNSPEPSKGCTGIKSFKKLSQKFGYAGKESYFCVVILKQWFSKCSVLCCSIMYVLIFCGELNNQKRETKVSFFCVHTFRYYKSSITAQNTSSRPVQRCVLCTGKVNSLINKGVLQFQYISSLVHWWIFSSCSVVQSSTFKFPVFCPVKKSCSGTKVCLEVK